MSRQLTFSATVSTLSMAVLALAMGIGASDAGGTRDATAHGSIVTVLLGA